MKKIIILLCLLVLTFVSYSQSQYTPMTAAGYQEKRLKVDSSLHIPSFCGVPTLRNSTAIQGALAMDTCNNKLYKWTRAAGWSEVSGGGGGSTDTTSLSNRINQKVNISDTASMLTPYLRKVDTTAMLTPYLRKVDTTAMLTPYLREVDTTNKFVNNIVRISGKDSIIFYKGSSRFAIKDSVGANPPASGYYGAFDDSTTQSAAIINTAYPIKLNRTTLSNAVTIANNGSGQPTRITINNSGIYNIQFSLQLEKTGGSGNMTADIWLRENGIDVPNSTGKVVLTGSANASPVIASWNYVINVVGGYYYELMWSTSNVNVEIVASVASSPHPAIPSVILTVTQQSGIMAGTGITAMNGLTGAAQTFAVDSSNSTFKITSTGTSHTFNIPDASTSGVTRGLISNTQYSTFNSKIGAGDTATMLNPYLRKADTTAMLSKYLRIVDTTAFQRRNIGAYSFQANKTSAAANTTSNVFKDTTGVYTGTITWTGTTAPSGATSHTYSFTQIGKMVTLRINLVYATVGLALSQVAMTLPAECPAPLEPTGLGAANEILYSGYGYLLTLATTQNSAFQRAYLRANAADNGYEVLVAGTGAAYKLAYVTIIYFTN